MQTNAVSRAAVPWVQPTLQPDAWLVAEMTALLHGPTLTNHGPHVRALEAGLQAWLRDEVAAVSSGAMALQLALLALAEAGEIRAGQAAILPACTYVATLNAVEHAGLRPVFCDIEPASWTMAPAALAELLATHRDTAVVLPVNVYGVPPDLATLGRLAHAAGARVVYDNAHGLGTSVRGEVAPGHVDLTAWSLHATKLLPAAEGGFVSGRPDWLERVRQLRCHGLSADPLASRPGYNAKLSELHALLARSGLSRLDAIVAQRRANWQQLLSRLAALGPGLARQEVPAGVDVNAQNLTVLVRDARGEPDAAKAQAWMAALDRRGVETRRYFWPPLHQLQRSVAHSRKHGARQPGLPVTERIMPALVSLPLHTQMPEPVLAHLHAAWTSAWEEVESVQGGRNA